ALGALYRRTNQSAQAVTAYQRALALAHSKRQKKRYLRALANMALARRDLPSARAFFKKLVSLDPRNIFLRIELAQALARAKLRKEAITQYQHILARTRDSGTRASVLKSIGKLQHELGRTDAAVATYRKAMRLAARGHWIRRELTDRIITIYREKEDLKGLIAYYKKRWKHRGHFEWNILGRLYDETGDEIRATKAYRAALKKKSRAIDTRVRLIALLERSGHGAEVIAEYRKLAYLASAEPRYQFELAKRLHRAGKGTEAIQVLERVARRFPRDASVHSALADLFARWGKRRLALREARKLVQIEPRDASHIVNLGEQYFLRGNKRRALEVWKRLLSAIPQRHRAYAKLASIYGDHDMVPKAIKLYKKAIKLKPKLIPYRRALALLLEGKRLYHKALGAWKTVFSLAQAQKAQQTLREARTHTIDIMHRTYHLKQEIRNRARLFAQSPPDIEAGFFIAEAYRKTRNIKKSVRTYVQILVFRPKNVEALSALESAYRSLHRYARAVKVLKRLASLQPKRRREYYQRIADLELLLYNDKEAVIYAQKAVTLGRQDARAYQRLGELYEKKEDFKAA
ncbi:MAG: tetratricopeptide repeat protein, partial [Deltaproteobacteria bacterium]|nr:tetratricopeptide repeat protein [Deltaproteobacteria bacterium]